MSAQAEVDERRSGRKKRTASVLEDFDTIFR
jgi:hypothetical protein